MDDARAAIIDCLNAETVVAAAGEPAACSPIA